MIKTWQALVGDIASTTYQGYVTKEEIDACKQAEIDELRAEIERLNSGWYDKLLKATLERDAEIAELKMVAASGHKYAKENAAQRKVLETALEALSYIRTRVEDGWNTTTQDRLRESAITAIQGVLK